jgi:dienelactone hydrolase
LIERISFNAAYGNERMIAYLFLPRNINPPYQTIIFVPAINAFYEKDAVNSFISRWYLDFIIKSGRAVIYPIYKGTFERKEMMEQNISCKSHEYTEYLIKIVKDFSRTIDYLESRADIDTSRLGYYGHSWGGEMGGIIPAVEDRLALCILNLGGFDVYNNYLPGVDAINYVPRIKIPVLMLNGRYDNVRPLKESVMPFFNLLGTPKFIKKPYIEGKKSRVWNTI